MRLIILLAGLLFGVPAMAGGTPGGPNGFTPILPPNLTGQGTMTVTGSSAAINSSNVTATGSSPAFPTAPAILPNTFLTIKVQGSQTAMIAVCWLGGTCTFATGEVIEVGESSTRNLQNGSLVVPPTVISQSGSVVISVEW